MKRKLFTGALILLAMIILTPETYTQTAPVVSPEMTAARELLREQKWPEAERAFAEIVQKEPENARAWFNLGYARHSQEKWESAVEAFKKAADIAQIPGAIYNVAAGYARLGQKDLAFEWLERALTGGAAFGSNISADVDFENIRKDSRFAKMLEIVERQTKPCLYSAESRQFDFWIGDWDVFVGGNKVGENLVELEMNGCTLVENWKNTSGGLGKSLNTYNSSTQKWQQFYVDSTGSVLEFSGVFKDKIMRMTGETAGPDGSKTQHILEFFDLPDKTVRQRWQQSTDGGKTWTTVWDSIYVRKNAAT